MPLNLAELGKIYTIHRIGGLEKDKHHLENLGLVPGQELKLLSGPEGYSGSIITGRMCIENG